MKLDEFLTELLENILIKESITKIKSSIEEEMSKNGLDYKTTKVEGQVFTKENNYDPRIEIKSDSYEDGEVIFIDYFLE